MGDAIYIPGPSITGLSRRLDRSRSLKTYVVRELSSHSRQLTQLYDLDANTALH